MIVRAFSFKAAILCFALFFSDHISALENDSLKKWEFSIAGGSKFNFAGPFATAGFCYHSNNLVFDLDYNYSHSHYVKLDNFSGFLEQTYSISATAGYQFSFKKFDFPLSAGMIFGKGSFALNGSQDYSYTVSNYSLFIKTNYFGFILNGSVKYNLTKRIRLGLNVTSFFNYYYKHTTAYSSSDKNYYLAHIDNYFGLQLGLSYAISKWEK